MRRIIKPFILCLLLATTSCSAPNNDINTDIDSGERQIETEESQPEPMEA